MTPHFNSSLELTIQGRKQSCGPAQAEVILKNFFTKNPPRDFKLLHKGSAAHGGTYMMGTLTTTAGTRFRTTLVFFTKNGRDLVHQMRFE